MSAEEPGQAQEVQERPRRVQAVQEGLERGPTLLEMVCAVQETVRAVLEVLEAHQA